MAPHSSTLAWKISWTEEPGRLQSRPPNLLSKLSYRRRGELFRSVERRWSGEGFMQPGPEIPVGKELKLEQGYEIRLISLETMATGRISFAKVRESLCVEENGTFHT